MHISQLNLILIIIGSAAAVASFCTSIFYIILQERSLKRLHVVPSAEVKAEPKTIYVSVGGKPLEVKGAPEDVQKLLSKIKVSQKINANRGPIKGASTGRMVASKRSTAARRAHRRR
jgi:hypothetical protein